METNIVDILLSIGVPAGTKGFTYICDAMEMFDKDPYYAGGKIGVLYHEIAKKRDSTSSRVERAIRHAFVTAIKKGEEDQLKRYLDLSNTQNSNLLRTLYLKSRNNRLISEKNSTYNKEKNELKKQIYMELLDWLLEKDEREADFLLQ